MEFSTGCGWNCDPPFQGAVLLLLGAVVLLFVWRAMRPPRPPDWWHVGKRRRRQ